MKKTICICISFILLCLTLCGCSSSGKVPYLSESERERVESELIENMKIYVYPEFTSGDVLLRGDSKYNIYNIYMGIPGEPILAFNFHSLPKSSSTSQPFHLRNGDSIDSVKSTEYYIQYSIGAYTYQTKTFYPPNVQEASDAKLEIILKTDDGQEILRPGEKVKFSTGRELDGISRSRLDYLYCDATYTSYSDSFNMTIQTEGKDSGISVGYQLITEDGLVTQTGTLYFDNGSATLYFFSGNGIAPGTYTLKFFELT